ncbi:hypothetical protein SDC9_152399 [bioreactor metagenome]|uniref:Uncharacterized protein n=1 Tax=bioreactor metagenome TaxID=1076179 RepID=A0A645EVB9_9ZZZZ
MHHGESHSGCLVCLHRIGRQHTFAQPDASGLDMAQGSRRAGPHQQSLRVGPPAQVDSVTEKRDRRVKPAELPPGVHGDEQAGGGCAQHLGRLLLVLVDVAGFDGGHPLAGRRDGLTHRAHLVGVIAPLGTKQLRHQDRRAPALVIGDGGGQQQFAERASVRRGVVVQ